MLFPVSKYITLFTYESLIGHVRKNIKNSFAFVNFDVEKLKRFT